MKNVHVIPTEHTSRLYYNRNDKSWQLCEFPKYHTDIKSTYNLYITSDEEIKEGDWFIRDGSIHKCFRVHKTDIEFLTSIDSVYCGSNTFWSKEFCKKIILTTDQDLIGVQAIDDEFLEWFVKNPSCEEVEVEGHIYKGQDETEYKIIIPSEESNPFELPKVLSDDVFYKSLEPKQETTEEITERVFCNKKETLEEVAERLLRQHPDFEVEGMSEYQNGRFNGIIEGVEWQQEQDKNKYSEEEVLILLHKRDAHNMHFPSTFNKGWKTPKEWFKQFKKK